MASTIENGNYGNGISNFKAFLGDWFSVSHIIILCTAQVTTLLLFWGVRIFYKDYLMGPTDILYRLFDSLPGNIAILPIAVSSL
jgi:hypothetical protein